MNNTTPLSEDQISTYYRQGYVVAPGLAPAKEIDAIMAELADFPVVRGGAWTPRTLDLAHPEKEAGLHRLLITPRVLGAAQQIFEAPAQIYYGMVAIVPAHGGRGLDWHQDNQYSYICGRALNIFVALNDITPDMAILWVAPGSHLHGRLPSHTNADGHQSTDVAPANGQALPGMKKGDVCIFDRHTLHRSLTNTTDRHRYAYAAQYCEAKARDPKTGLPIASAIPSHVLQERWQTIGVA